ncbi:aminoglycoside phosphotransferase family protein [Mycobacterium deserti]|uniref:Aminoglycoside phosphotransferase family protein n=1 Tax=Mycobacterium deserti TaxID=2978347 RepID=A0ABT2M801_9MYCO|nr:aminoglycoside phosphotransferase family protein [Mycobacterium deserti]MCT7658393.1 aminoglycoside phosphotransferase family protein [Mycobacterium deserti]
MTTRELLAQWQLRDDGEPIVGRFSVVHPVRTADGSRAALKIGQSEHEHIVLRRWGGDGAVRLLRADPTRQALLLEPLHTDSLEALPDIDACDIVAGLYSRLHIPAVPQLRTLPTLLGEWATDFDSLPRSAPIPHRLVEQAATLCRELAQQPAPTVVHGNLHYANVLAADREPWLAISPTPVNGDPHYELAPMLWHRWDEFASDIRGGVQRRFYRLVDAAGFDENLARAWVLVRVLREATRARADLTRFVALAKAVQD